MRWFFTSWFKGKRKNTWHMFISLFLLYLIHPNPPVWLHFSKTGYDVTKRTGEASHVNEQLRRTVKELRMLESWMWADVCYRHSSQADICRSVLWEKPVCFRVKGKWNIPKVGGWVSISLWLVSRWLTQTPLEQTSYGITKISLH